MRQRFMRQQRTGRRRRHRPLNVGAEGVATTPWVTDARCLVVMGGAVVVDGAVVTGGAKHHHAYWSPRLISTPALRRD